MKLAVMQPYLFPYLGYFQLVCACDEFVIYDDVQYIKRGWVNRNAILENGRKHEFTAAVLGASRTRDFNEVVFAPQPKLLKTIYFAYKRAPYFDAVYSMIERVLTYGDRRVARLVGFSIGEILDYIGLKRVVSYASALNLDTEVRGQARILEICRSKGATMYINAPGGVDLYEAAAFRRAGIELLFLQPESVRYAQFGEAFVENLSIIDVLMFNSPGFVAQLAERYELLPP